eukprot:GHVU01146825.1.p1 GENE.GHVU01146825.1~~GHVU01146825.1.p1  ORF type:complete len:340 (-),score=-4.58 GHVU01146825.1:281-1243(-)
MSNLSEYAACNHTEHQEIREHFYVYGLTVGIICALGLAGNTLCFIVLQVDKKKCSATFLLKALAITDNLFLIHILLIRTILYTLEYGTDSAHPTFKQYLNITTYFWPFSHIARHTSIWMTVLIAVNRYIAVCKPLRAATLCTMKKTRVQVIIMFLCVCIYNIPHFLAESVYGNMADQFYAKGSYFSLLYNTISYMTFVLLGPFLILLVSNTLIIRKLWTARKQRMEFRNQMTSDNKNERNLTVVIVMVVVVFCICNTPACVLRFLVLFYDHLQFQSCRWCMWFYHSSQILVYLNSSVNFIIYFVFRKQFRKYLISLCRQQ